MKCECLFSYIYKALCIYLHPINLTLSPVIFISIKLSLPGENDVTSIERIAVGSDLTRFLPQFQYQKTNKICKKNKDAWYYVFQFFKHFWFPQPIRFLLLKSLTQLLREKYCNYPLTTTRGDRFVSCENIVSRSQTSSLPPPPVSLFSHLFVPPFATPSP